MRQFSIPFWLVGPYGSVDWFKKQNIWNIFLENDGHYSSSLPQLVENKFFIIQFHMDFNLNIYKFIIIISKI